MCLKFLNVIQFNIMQAQISSLQTMNLLQFSL